MSKPVMGSKPKQEKVENKGLTVQFDKVEGKTRRATGSGAKPFWYLEHTGDLEMITTESSNEAIGIKSIQVFEPTQKQAEIGILCKIRLVTETTVVDNISIFPSEFAEGDIYLQMGGGRNIGTHQEPKWVRDCKLTAKAKAQILSYVSTLLKK